MNHHGINCRLSKISQTRSKFEKKSCEKFSAIKTIISILCDISHLISAYNALKCVHTRDKHEKARISFLWQREKSLRKTGIRKKKKKKKKKIATRKSGYATDRLLENRYFQTVVADGIALDRNSYTLRTGICIRIRNSSFLSSLG